MKAFEVYLNGNRLWTAGVGDDGVLATGLTWVGGNPPRPSSRMDFRVGGVDVGSDERLDWPTPPIGVGDEITIRIIETDRVDPANRSPVQDVNGGATGRPPSQDG